jgi:predicted ATP-grasp superfamily ATP-dependent carboligase
MEALTWEHRPNLRRPVLVAAFEGWNDAGDAASTAARYLAETWQARRFATIDPEEFYDFTSTRPQVRLDEEMTRHIDWPISELSAASVPASPHDVVFLHAVEPQLRWRTYASLVAGVVNELGVELVLSLGALMTDTPHTRPVRVTGTGTDPALVARLGLIRSRYEGPTGIVGVLHDALAAQGIPSASLWANVPHYVQQTPSPKAALALVRRASDLLGAHVEALDLQIAAASYERQVSEVVASDDDVAEYVRRLEAGFGDDDDDDDDRHELPEGDALAAEVERFLREQGGS